jgi:crotonobetainyl-CoA:carnitine CoA-transferase CaiB-like acyl-CoA transferase
VAAHEGGPLKGIKVLDLTQYQNGPSATAQLSDNGADVLKLEAPSGEGMRRGPRPGTKLTPDYFLWEAFNRGKRSMTLDLKHPSANLVMERLVKWADVVCENFRPGIMEKLGFGWEVLRAWNPRVIFAQNSGFGDKGEWAERPSFDGIAQAFTGVMVQAGGGPSYEPRNVDWTFSDEVGAVNFYASICAALVARSMDKDLRGKKVLEKLCKWADVLCENFRPGVMEKLGFGYEQVRDWNPRLIYASNSGFGPVGEWSKRPSYDGMAQAFTGILSQNGGGPSFPPRPVPWVLSDMLGANNFYGAILAAIIARQRQHRSPVSPSRGKQSASTGSARPGPGDRPRTMAELEACEIPPQGEQEWITPLPPREHRTAGIRPRTGGPPAGDDEPRHPGTNTCAVGHGD